MIVSIALVLIESGVWMLTHHTTHTQRDLLRRMGTGLERRFANQSEKGLHPGSMKHKIVSYLGSGAFRDIARRYLIRPLEVPPACPHPNGD